MCLVEILSPAYVFSQVWYWTQTLLSALFQSHWWYSVRGVVYLWAKCCLEEDGGIPNVAQMLVHQENNKSLTHFSVRVANRNTTFHVSFCREMPEVGCHWDTHCNTFPISQVGTTRTGGALSLKTPFTDRHTRGCWPIGTTLLSSKMPEIADLCRLMVLQVKPFWNRDCRYSRSFLHKLKMCPTLVGTPLLPRGPHTLVLATGVFPPTAFQNWESGWLDGAAWAA